MGNIIISAHFPIFIFTITQKSFNKNFTKKNYRNPFRIITTVRVAQLAFLRKKLRFSLKKDEIFRNWREKWKRGELLLLVNGSYVRLRQVNKSCDSKNYFVNNDLFKNLQISIFEVENV